MENSSLLVDVSGLPMMETRCWTRWILIHQGFYVLMQYSVLGAQQHHSNVIIAIIIAILIIPPTATSLFCAEAFRNICVFESSEFYMWLPDTSKRLAGVQE